MMEQRRTMDRPLRILFAEDTPTDAELNFFALQSGGIEFSYRLVHEREDFIRELEEYDPDIILSDYMMPQFTGGEALEIAKARKPEIPFIIITGSMNEETAVECMRNGADDYLIKGHLDRLPTAIKQAIKTKQLELKERQTNNRIHHAAREWRATFDAMHDGVALIDTDRRITRCNTALKSLIGKSWEQIIGQTCCGLLHGSEEPREGCPVQRTLQTRTRQSYQTVIDDRWFEFIADPIISEDGEITSIVHSVIDITSRIALEAQVRQSQKLESIGTLAGGVAHEINNPINGIMNYAQLILDKLGPDHEVSPFVEEISKETDRIAVIVKNLLSFARQDKQSCSPARMYDIVESTLSLVKTIMRHDQIALEVSVPDTLPKISCRSQQIQQVLLNLLTNARDALNEKYPEYDEKKKISLTSRIVETGDKKWIRTIVEDSGPGIPENMLRRIFDPFFTQKPRDTGTGLGLSISHGIIQEHNGSLSVESEVGEWTRFCIDLPAQDIGD